MLNMAKDLFEKGLEDLLEQVKHVRDADIDLTLFGEWQSQCTGELLSEENPFDMCFASPYKRTVRTAQGIISNIGYPLKLFTDNRLREKEFGRFHGLSKQEIIARHPEEFESRKRDGVYWYRLPGGENYPDVEMRVHSFLDKLVRDYSGKRVLIVTHEVPYKMFRALFEHLSEEGVLSLPDAPNCGIQIFSPDTAKFQEGRMVLKMYNRIAYNPSDYKGPRPQLEVPPIG